MKLFISVVLLCISTFIGYKKFLEFKKKQKYYKDFIDFNNLLISEIKFGMKTIKQLLFNITAKNCVTESIKEIIFTSDNNIDINFIDESEKKFLIDYSKTIGTSDADSQLSYLNKINNQLNQKYEIALKNYEKFGNLYIKLGFLIGLILFIIIL